jgi:hypothetical protein
MHIRTNGGTRSHSIAALIASLALGVSGIAGATTGGATAAATPIASAKQTLDLVHNASNGRAQGYAAYVSSVRFSASKAHQRNKGCNWCALSGGTYRARALPTSVATSVPASFEFATLTAAPTGSNAIDSPADVSEILATDIAFVSDRNVTPVRFVGRAIARLETGMNWRSNAFSIAGSRVWSKIIKFSSTGVNVRVPLN